MTAPGSQQPDGSPPANPPGADEPPPAPQDGDAVRAIADAEVALAHQNSVTAQVDLQVISAILNAHLTAAEGRDALNKLQQETEAAIRTRADLDTPAGARDFQRFLIGKLRDIRTVVASASLDATSKSALMTAWTSLYGLSKAGPAGTDEGRPTSASPVATPPKAAGQESPVMPEAGLDPYLESLLAADPGVLVGDGPPPRSPVPPMPIAPMPPGIPSMGGGPMPAAGPMPGWGAPGGVPLPGLLHGAGDERSPRGSDSTLTSPDPKDRPSSEEPANPKDPQAGAPSAEAPEAPPAGPTTVTLPNGDTVTAASPALAAAIKAAVGGMAIPDAFRQQGITIPPPGSRVAVPIDPGQVTAGDIGIFTDRHALALGHDKALLSGQIQHISTVKGPSFLGWEHPPMPATGNERARGEAPTPTRPAAETAGQNGGTATQSRAH